MAKTITTIQHEDTNDVDVKINKKTRLIKEFSLVGRLNTMQSGKTYPVIDSLLVATAITYGMTMVTRNVDDFKRSDLSIRSPWEDYS